MLTLLRNQVLIQIEPVPASLRVLWIEPPGLAPQRVAIFDLGAKGTLPSWIELDALTSAVESGEFLLASVDTAATPARTENEIAVAAARVRDARYAILKSIVEDPEQRILYAESRGAIIAAVAQQHGTSRKNVYQLLRLYWGRGQTPNALLPDFEKCGRSGPRTSADARQRPKRGRPRKTVEGKDRRAGVNVDEQTRKLLLLGASRFIEKAGMRRKQAYEATIRTYFAVGLQPATDGTLIPILPPEDERPTFDQFTKHYDQSRVPRRAIIARKGVKRFLLENRPVLGSYSHSALGPGSQFQADTMWAIVALGSNLRRSRIIGFPLVNVVQDVFSRMIVGFHTCLEGPNWTSTKLGLQSAFGDKVEFCSRLGRQIAPEDWPCSNMLCQALLADRGPAECLSENADFLVNTYGVRFDTAAPARPDWKPFVERVIGIMKEEQAWQPGAVHEPRRRGSPDERLEAVHTLQSFARMFLEVVLQFNNCTWLDEYEPDAEVRREGVPLIPRELWNWGIQHRQGALRPVADADHLRRTLMRSQPATVTHRGIWVPGLKLHYTCPTADAEDWFVVERGRKRQVVELALEDRDVSEAYIRLQNGTLVEPCTLLSRYDQFKGKARDEVLDERAWQQVLAREAARELAQERTEHQHRIDLIVKEQTAARDAAFAETGEKPRIGSKEDRAQDRDKARRESLAAERPARITSAPPEVSGEGDEPVPAASELDLLRSLGEDE